MQVGKTFFLTESAVLFKDRGGRLHLAHNEEEYFVYNNEKIAHLPINTKIKILDAIYRISSPGRRNYFNIEVKHNNQLWVFEVHATGKYKPKWQERNK